jgi:hypothetical protein
MHAEEGAGDSGGAVRASSPSGSLMHTCAQEREREEERERRGRRGSLSLSLSLCLSGNRSKDGKPTRSWGTEKRSGGATAGNCER